MDNLRVHRNQYAVERMDELSFRWAWTPRYSPLYNDIEEVWAMSKRYIKQERLNAILNTKKINLKNLIKESFERMNVMSIRGCINRSL